MTRRTRVGLASCLVALLAAAGAASGGQGPAVAPPKDPQTMRAAAVLEAATEALGGPRYLAVTSQVSTGVFTQFVQGQRGLPAEFVDTFVFPDRNRTEFGKKKSRVVQSNSGTTGWKFEALRQTLEPQSPEEVAAFQRYVRANLDNVLRAQWRQPGVEVAYVGRLELAPRQWAEGVEIRYADGFRVEVYVDPQTHLPVASRYWEGSESGAPGSMLETRYFFWLDHGGVRAPRTVDLYRDQVQTARIVYDSVAFNAAVDPKVFVQPASAKDLK